jgi:hypothetical protein
MPGMFPAIGSAMGAEDVRNLQFGTMHWSQSLADCVEKLVIFDPLMLVITLISFGCS